MVTVPTQLILLVLRVGQAAVLGRLLTPGDFGLIAMVTAVTSIIFMFRDLGLPMAAIRDPKITPAQINSLFWINVAAAFVIGGIIAALSPLVAAYYGDPRLTMVTVALGGICVLGALGGQSIAMLQRKMQFFRLGCAEVGSTAMGIAVAILMAVNGAEYWALVAMQAVTMLSQAVIASLCAWWFPSLPRIAEGTKKLLALGGHLSLSEFAYVLSRNSVGLLLGRFAGAEALGFYSKARQLLMLPIHQVNFPIQKVALPALSQLQDDPTSFRKAYYRLVGTIEMLSAPMVAILIISAPDIIRVILGDQWDQAARVFRVLAVASFGMQSTLTTYWVLVALGMGSRQSKWSLIHSVIVVIAVACGLPWGVMGVATTYTCAMWLLRIPQLAWAFRETPVSVSGFFASTWTSLTIGVTMMLAMLLQKIFLPLEPMLQSYELTGGQLSLISIIVSCSVGCGTALVMIAAWPAARIPMNNLWDLLMHSIRARQGVEGGDRGDQLSD